MTTEHAEWQLRQGMTISVDIRPTPEQRLEIEWRACTGQHLNIATTGPRTAFLSEGLDLRAPAVDASAPRWMYSEPIRKVIPMLAKLEEVDPGVFCHCTERHVVRPSVHDLRRLRDGAAALALSVDLHGMTVNELHQLRQRLVDGALALQSMDDLGSPEANDAAWKDCIELGERITLVEQALHGHL